MAMGIALELNQLGVSARFSLENLLARCLCDCRGTHHGLACVSENRKETAGDFFVSTETCFAIWGGGEIPDSAPKTSGAEDLVAFMGGFDIDLRDADIEGTDATINVNAFYGWWRDSCSGNVGGLGWRGRGVHGWTQPEGARRDLRSLRILIVKGMAIMGGVEVRN